MPVPGSINAPKLFKAGLPSRIDSAVPLITLSVMSLTLPPNWTVTVIFPRLVSSSPDGPSNNSLSFSSLVDQSLIRVSAKDEAITVPSQPVSMVACVGTPLRSILTLDAFVFPTKRIRASLSFGHMSVNVSSRTLFIWVLLEWSSSWIVSTEFSIENVPASWSNSSREICRLVRPGGTQW